VSERVSGVVVMGREERIRGAVRDNLVFLRKIKSKAVNKLISNNVWDMTSEYQ
jgi:hypothetical protein